jgi:hypothetical protein
MALQSVKSIIQNKGYLIEQKDRAIFETGDLSSFFGFSQNDAIEFIVYDSNDNQLPQINGELVRYIPLSTENINDYFLIPTGTVFQKYKLPSEYFIDVERLLREAGYNNGIFKTQITLVNKRVGSEKLVDKMWISEISPSRTEIRLFPLIKNQPPELLNNLKERFNTFVDNKKFREDYINQSFQYIENINPSLIASFLKTKYSESFFNMLVNEYKIQSFDVFVAQIHKQFIEACVYEFTNRVSDINDNNYGKPKSTKPKITTSEGEIKKSIQRILVAILNKYLVTPDFVGTTTFDNIIDNSIDEVSSILQTTNSDTAVTAGELGIKKAAIEKAAIKVKSVGIETSIKLKEKIKKQLLPTESDNQPPPELSLPTDEQQPTNTPTYQTYEQQKGGQVGQFGAMNQVEIDQQKLLDALQEGGVNRGYGDAKQIAVRDRTQNQAVE